MDHRTHTGEALGTAGAASPGHPRAAGSACRAAAGEWSPVVASPLDITADQLAAEIRCSRCRRYFLWVRFKGSRWADYCFACRGDYQRAWREKRRAAQFSATEARC